MKRTNLVLDEQLLEEALRVSGERTYSSTVNRALRELVRRARAARILELAGSGLWDGDLATMRDDLPVANPAAPGRKNRTAEGQTAADGPKSRPAAEARRRGAKGRPLAERSR